MEHLSQNVVYYKGYNVTSFPIIVVTFDKLHRVGVSDNTLVLLRSSLFHFHLHEECYKGDDEHYS